ncbi:MAG: sulfite exporter TauE/SafE family protein [Candidatus Hermodarchaeota archaeon]
MQIALNIVLGALGLILLALICEYIDSAIGGGYGTILVPVLLIFGFDSDVVIPSVLFTEIWSGIGSSVLHNFVGNAKFEAKIDLANGKNLILSEDFKVSAILSVCGVLGGIIAVIIALSFPKMLVKTYIGVLVLIIGIMILLNLKWNFSWLRIWGIGLIAAFNKGISGGGYGPLVSGGQIIVDRGPKEAVASTSLSEAVVCISALAIYFLSGGVSLNIFLTLFLLIGSLISVPFAVLTVKTIPIEKFLPLIGLVTMSLGAFMLAKILFF